MKHLVLGLGLLAASTSTSFAQKLNAVKINVLSTGIRTGSFFYERKVTEQTTAQLGVAYTFLGLGTGTDRATWTGATITPEYRFYLTGEALDGFYLGPFARFRSFKLTNYETEYDGYTGDYTSVKRSANISAYGLGLVAGRQWLLGDIITLDVYGGPSYNGSSFSSKNGANPETFDYSSLFRGFGLRSGFTFGIAF